MDNIEETLIDLLKNQLGIKDNSLSLDSNFKDLDADSLDIVEFALHVEDKFQIEIPEESAEDIESVRDIANIVKTLINKK